MNIESTELQNNTEAAIGFIPCYRLPFLSLFHADCMEIMKQYPDKYFDLAIVDPPYGIHDKLCRKDSPKNKSKFNTLYYEKQWDKKRPDDIYWDEVLRISKNQIVFGANYFSNYLPISRGWIFWDKMGDGMSSVNNELIYTSFDISIKTFQRCHGMDKGFMNKEGTNIHPTQKPVKLYEWILYQFATEGMKILDTHFGSGSIALAVDKANRLDKMNLHLTACEIDKEYIDKAIKRISESIKQGTLSF